MIKTYITSTLLNAYTNGYDWISLIKREPVEKTKAMLNGEIFEKEVYNGNIKEASEYVKNSIYQPCLNGRFNDFYLFGYADFLLPNKIIDTKFKTNYNTGIFYNSNQHLIYTALANIKNFTYLIGVGTNAKNPTNIYFEEYVRNDDLLLSRLFEFNRTIDLLGLRKIYNENYSIERIIDKIDDKF